MKRKREVFFDCLKKNRVALIFFVFSCAVNCFVFFLYDIASEPLIYASILEFVCVSVLLVIDFIREYREAGIRERNRQNILTGSYESGAVSCLRDRDYREMLDILSNEVSRVITECEQKKQNDEDYYTSWVHQIKTPIAVMNLQLSENKDDNLMLKSELFRIEQYVGMVLDYNRLENQGSDLLLRSYPLDEIIKESIRKYASQFIIKHLKLNYVRADKSVVTDKKWLGFIIEQLLSNSIKYTNEGEIGISVTENAIIIRDTGIGIAADDLPRIFEKGFTGHNGRENQKSSGLGLYLTKKAANLISVNVRAESKAGSGSVFYIEFS